MDNDQLILTLLKNQTAILKEIGEVKAIARSNTVRSSISGAITGGVTAGILMLAQILGLGGSPA